MICSSVKRLFMSNLSGGRLSHRLPCQPPPLPSTERRLPAIRSSHPWLLPAVRIPLTTSDAPAVSGFARASKTSCRAQQFIRRPHAASDPLWCSSGVQRPALRRHRQLACSTTARSITSEATEIRRMLHPALRPAHRRASGMVRARQKPSTEVLAHHMHQLQPTPQQHRVGGSAGLGTSNGTGIP